MAINWHEWVVIMTDVVVKIEVQDPESEARLFQAVNSFAANRGAKSSGATDCEEAPQIMVKTIPGGEFFRKTVIFQDHNDAEEFMYYWHRIKQVA